MRPVSPDVVARFWSKVEKTSTCWLWTRASARGYPVFWFEGRQVKAYRFAWELANGPGTPGKHLHHDCRNRLCVRPSHLRELTSKEHFARHPERLVNLPKMRAATIARKGKKTHCLNGHRFTEASSYIDPRGFRQCRICRTQKVAEHKQRKRALAA